MGAEHWPAEVARGILIVAKSQIWWQLCHKVAHGAGAFKEVM